MAHIRRWARTTILTVGVLALASLALPRHRQHRRGGELRVLSSEFEVLSSKF
jgi:hypothetical protein